MVADEAATVVRRINGIVATEAITLRSAIVSVLAEDGSDFEDVIKRLTGA